MVDLGVWIANSGVWITDLDHLEHPESIMEQNST
jgi:hypothetical protein